MPRSHQTLRNGSAALLACCVAGAGTCPDATRLSGGTTYTESGTGKAAEGYRYSLFNPDPGAGSLTVYGKGAAFKGTWRNSDDFLAGMGLIWEGAPTYDRFASIEADFAFAKSGSAGGFSMVGLHGMSSKTLVEYYIIEDWFGSARPSSALGAPKSVLEIDSGTYDIYTGTHGASSGISEAVYRQIFSIRRTPRQCGHISVTGHFDAWKALGQDLGGLYDLMLSVETVGGIGQIDFTAASIVATPRTTSVAPSPEHGGANARTTRSGLLTVTTLDGKRIRCERGAEAIASRSLVDALPRGVYMLRFRGDDGSVESRTLARP